jgi:hypothetical protein
MFLGDQLQQYGTAVKRFRELLCLHHQGMMLFNTDATGYPRRFYCNEIVFQNVQ